MLTNAGDCTSLGTAHEHGAFRPLGACTRGGLCRTVRTPHFRFADSAMLFRPPFVSVCMGGGGAGLCLKGRGAIGEIPERLQSGHGGCEAVGGRLLAVGNAVGAGVGVWECLWGRVGAGVLGGEGYPPPSSNDSLGRGDAPFDQGAPRIRP